MRFSRSWQSCCDGLAGCAPTSNTKVGHLVRTSSWTRHTWAAAIVEVTGLPVQVAPISGLDFVRIWHLPARAVLQTTDARAIQLPNLDWC